ncbi:branched-chain amino acid ABC transporter permease [Actinoplanes sp. NPDC026619]|uniref:branched-chain amino acid ABC transporter permease n=1 Tax=Actinoplanes sp. NPDC026619 TaxID=3155798 RepID=UPI0033DCA8DE
MGELLQYLVTGVGIGCAYALTGSGLVVIYRVTRVVNFAQGSFAVLAALTVTTLLAAGLPHGLAEALAVLVAALTGLIAGAVATGKPGTTPQAGLIITLGLGVFAYAVEILLWGDQPRSFAGVPGSIDGIQKHYLLIIAVTAVVLGATALLFARTDLGRALTATAADPYAARIVGINVLRMGLFAFALGGALGGLAGVLITPVQQVSFDSDVALVVSGFSAAILGNLTRPGLTLAGGLLLGVVQALVGGYLSTAYQSEVALIFMLVVLVARAGRREVLEAA